MRTVILSDLHLGSSGGIDLLRKPGHREALWAELEGAEEVVLLGDAIELRDRPLPEALELARPFFAELASAIGDARVLVVPGNHDHHLLTDWLERRRLGGAESLELEQLVPVESGPLAELVRGTGLQRIELAYPGAWLRPGVYATHGHFLDRHLTVPTFERLAVAAVERVLTGPKDAANTDPLASFEAGAASPDDYERAQAPVYAFLFALAQAGATGERLGGANPSARVWQALGGGYGRAARLRGWLLGTVAVPGAVGVANRLGLGPVRADLSPGAVTRAGLAAIGEVVHRLGIEADHLIFGHTHRRGPMRGEQGWRLESGTRLWNTGSWVYAPGLLGRSAAESPYWPGTVVVLEGERQPELRHLLDHLAKAELGD
ncbi:MAG TPA: metallophosphoesterase [Solirubrobacterales bacterium]|jgi:predicted phosphodiesterase